jgi:hypothetical protein
MPVSVTVDYSAFRARMAAMRKRGNSAREAFLLAVGISFVQAVVKFSPRDTHRYVRGWMQAARGAGIRTDQLPAIVQSKKRDKIIEALTRQVSLTRAAEGRLRATMELWYVQANRPRRGYYHTLQRKIEKAAERSARAEEELKKFLQATGAVVMMRGSGAALNGYQRQLSGDAINLTVRDKVYGGRGRLTSGSTTSGLMLHNLEPHSRVVEKYRGVVRRARAALGAAGLQQLKGEYVGRLASDARTAGKYRAGLARNGITV